LIYRTLTSLDVNLLLELLISLEQNEEALEVLCQYSNAKFSSSSSPESVAELPPEQQLQTFRKVVLPDDTPLDINSKLVVVLVNLKAKHLVQVSTKDTLDWGAASDLLSQEISQVILESDPEEFGDLMLDIGEAFMSQDCHQEALSFLEKLVHSQEYAKVRKLCSTREDYTCFFLSSSVQRKIL
jgi:hypothetical protein